MGGVEEWWNKENKRLRTVPRKTGREEGKKKRYGKLKEI